MRITAEEVALREWDKLMARASGLGHRLTDPKQDTEVSLVAECSGCDVLFAVDGQERPYQYSTGLYDKCEGTSIC